MADMAAVADAAHAQVPRRRRVAARAHVCGPDARHLPGPDRESQEACTAVLSPRRYTGLCAWQAEIRRPESRVGAPGVGYRVSVAYWSSRRALSHITPGRTEWPEGEGYGTWLAAVMPYTVVEFGCGTGRLAAAFGPERYIGVDVSAYALREARARLPSHDFRQIAGSDELPEADAAFAHTVLLHVPDGDLATVVMRLAASAPCVLVGEIMARRWRRLGDPPVYNREPGEYTAAFAAAGMTLREHHEWPYHRYGGVTLDVLEFER